jgi:hypothetical protein
VPPERHPDRSLVPWTHTSTTAPSGPTTPHPHPSPMSRTRRLRHRRPARASDVDTRTCPATTQLALPLTAGVNAPGASPQRQRCIESST